MEEIRKHTSNSQSPGTCASLRPSSCKVTSFLVYIDSPIYYPSNISDIVGRAAFSPLRWPLLTARTNSGLCELLEFEFLSLIIRFCLITFEIIS